MGNKIDELVMENSLKDTLILNKDKQIETLRWRDTVRTNQLAESNFKLMQSEKDIKRLKRTILLWKIVGLVGFSLAILSVL